MKIWCDGGKQKLGEISVYREDGNISTIKDATGTINLLEYKAVLLGLEFANDGDIIFSDSKLIVYQILGWWKINKSHLQNMTDKCRKILQEKQVRIFWIPRHKNKAGKLLALKKNKKKKCNKSNKKFTR